jgi:hypothetical protein
VQSRDLGRVGGPKDGYDEIETMERKDLDIEWWPSTLLRGHSSSSGQFLCQYQDISPSLQSPIHEEYYDDLPIPTCILYRHSYLKTSNFFYVFTAHSSHLYAVDP